MKREDAEATIRFCIRDTMAATADQTGLVAGPASDELIENIYQNLIEPSMKVCFEAVWNA